MAAIITDTLKKQIILDIVDDIDSAANEYFVGIGRSETWGTGDDAPTPLNSTREIRNAMLSLQSVKTIADKSFVVPRYNWSSGTTYSAWNDNVAGYPAQPFYVYTDENHIYVCLEQGRNAAGQAQPSTVKPTGTADHLITSDGYTWKFLYSVGALKASKFVSANYIPVTKILSTDDNSPADEVEQEGIQNNATAGEIVGYRVTDGGSGYTSAPTVTIVGNGTGAKATATISGAAISKIEMKESSGEKVFGSGYDYANIVISGGGGTGATAVPILGPKNGFGADPRDDLRSTAIMFNAKPSGLEDSDFIIGNDFRQVMLLRNPLDSDGGNVYTGETGLGLKRMDVTSIVNTFTKDNTIQGGTSQAKAIVDATDADSIFYHQTEATGFTPFQDGETVTEVSGNGEATIDSAEAAGSRDLAPLTSEVLYIDNRAAVTRSADATEDIKIVIQL